MTDVRASGGGAMADDDLRHVGGWLLVYVVLKFAISAAVLLFLLAFAPPHDALQFAAVGGMVSGFAAGIGIVRHARWGITAVAIDMAFMLLFFFSSVWQQGLWSGSTVVREVVEFLIFAAFVEYFRSSRRVRAVLGRNLFRPH